MMYLCEHLLVIRRLQLHVVDKHLGDAHLLAQKVQHFSLVSVLNKNVKVKMF